MTTNGTTCQGEGCTHKPVTGMSYCSEDHYEQLVDERKARQHYRSAAPVLREHDFSASLKPPTNKGLIKPPKPEPKPMEPEQVAAPEPVIAAAREWDDRWMRGLSPETNKRFVADIKLPVATLMVKYKVSETAVRNMKRRCGVAVGPQPAALANGRKPAPVMLEAITADPANADVLRAVLEPKKPPSLLDSFDAVIAALEADIAEQTMLLKCLKARREKLA